MKIVKLNSIKQLKSVHKRGKAKSALRIKIEAIKPTEALIVNKSEVNGKNKLSTLSAYASNASTKTKKYVAKSLNKRQLAVYIAK